MPDIRPIANIIEPQYVIEGAGVLLRRSIAPRASNEFDPFLLFDHFAFNDPIEGPIRGFPYHPHRGIETVTYMLAGSVHHRDSLGNAGLIGPGDVQWMTSGRGILHEEMPRRGPNGEIYGFQLWVNLPAALKMSAPRYQEIAAAAIPVHAQDGASIRVVAGQVDGVAGPVTEIAAAPLYMEVGLAPGVEWTQPVPAGHTALAYVFEGRAHFGDQLVEAVRLARFGDGDAVQVRTEAEPARFEPIVPYGPFVMNTRAEIQQALLDLKNGRFVS
jgi:redox-sensitive bicupin YhaK (pirin superfamily)